MKDNYLLLFSLFILIFIIIDTNIFKLHHQHRKIRLSYRSLVKLILLQTKNYNFNSFNTNRYFYIAHTFK